MHRDHNRFITNNMLLVSKLYVELPIILLLFDAFYELTEAPTYPLNN